MKNRIKEAPVVEYFSNRENMHKSCTAVVLIVVIKGYLVFGRNADSFSTPSLHLSKSDFINIWASFVSLVAMNLKQHKID